MMQKIHYHIKEERNQDPDICARCSRLGATCCSLEPGQEPLCFPLSHKEWERILDFEDLKGAFIQEPNSPPFLAHLRRLFPGEGALLDKVFPAHGAHLRLATRRDGSCIFLGPQGCALPRQARPYYCRVFPFWLYGRRLTMFASHTCLASREHATPASALAALGVSEARVRELHGRLRLAWGLPPSPSMDPIPTKHTKHSK